MWNSWTINQSKLSSALSLNSYTDSKYSVAIFYFWYGNTLTCIVGNLNSNNVQSIADWCMIVSINKRPFQCLYIWWHEWIFWKAEKDEKH